MILTSSTLKLSSLLVLIIGDIRYILADCILYCRFTYQEMMQCRVQVETVHSNIFSIKVKIKTQKNWAHTDMHWLLKVLPPKEVKGPVTPIITWGWLIQVQRSGAIHDPGWLHEYRVGFAVALTTKNSSCKFFEPEDEIQILAMQKIVTTTSTCG